MKISQRAKLAYANALCDSYLKKVKGEKRMKRLKLAICLITALLIMAFLKGG